LLATVVQVMADAAGEAIVRIGKSNCAIKPSC
jgi:hypothetical protein